MLRTTIAGSLPKPTWLAESERLWAPWKLEGVALQEGRRDATILAVKLQQDAGIDIVGDGEQARQQRVVRRIEGDHAERGPVALVARAGQCDVANLHVTAPVPCSAC